MAFDCSEPRVDLKISQLLIGHGLLLPLDPIGLLLIRFFKSGH